MTPTPAEPAEAFGAAGDRAVRYEQLLATEGVEWGLIGPREQDRLWTRHILNSVALTSLVAPDARVIDVGSGAGLPGIPLALARPDLRVTLLEPLARRVDFLNHAVRTLELSDRVEVVRGRAEGAPRRAHDVVTARAVAPLAKLLGWCLPLMAPGGCVLAIKGERAPEEITAARSVLRKSRMTAEFVERTTFGELTRVVVVRSTDDVKGTAG